MLGIDAADIFKDVWANAEQGEDASDDEVFDDGNDDGPGQPHPEPGRLITRSQLPVDISERRRDALSDLVVAGRAIGCRSACALHRNMFLFLRRRCATA